MRQVAPWRWAALIGALAFVAACSGGDAGGSPAGDVPVSETPARPSAPAPPDDPIPEPSPTPDEDDGGPDEAGPDEAGQDDEEPGVPAEPHRELGPRPEGIDELAEQVSVLRGIPVDEPLVAEVLPPRELGARFVELAFAEVDEEEVADEGALLTALRLVPEGTDLLETVRSLYGDVVIGLYEIDDGVLAIGSDTAELSANERATAAHEVVHALQDRRYDLAALREAQGDDDDAQLALLALIEGDATVFERQWRAAYQSQEERDAAIAEALEGGEEIHAAFAAAPPYVRESLQFPYREGSIFVSALLDARGPAGLEAAYAAPPRSTLEVMDPGRYLDGFTAASVPVPAPPSDPWRAGADVTFGAFDLEQLLAPLGADTARDLAMDWAGGRAQGWHDGGRSAVALVLAASDPGSATRLCDAMGRWYAAVAGADLVPPGQARQGDRDVMALECSPRGIGAGLAPDAALAGGLAAAP